jgi:hypothetical protein
MATPATANAEDALQAKPSPRKPKDPLVAAANAATKLVAAIEPSLTDEPFQVFEPLSPAEEKRLRADIKANGVVVPVHVTADGWVIDGHHRVRIFSEIEPGSAIPAVMILDPADPFPLSAKSKEAQKRLRRFNIVEKFTVEDFDPFQWAVNLNADRRQVTPEARKAAVIKGRKLGKSYRLLADELNVSVATVQRDAAGVSPETPDGKVIGKDGKAQASTKPKRSVKKESTTPKRKPLAQLKREAALIENVDGLFPLGIGRQTTDEQWRAAGIEPYKNPEPVVHPDDSDSVTRLFLINLKELTGDVDLFRQAFVLLPKGKKTAALRKLQEEIGELVALRSELEAS